MTYATDKTQFFSKIKEGSSTDVQFAKARQFAAEHDYQFILTHQRTLEAEFNHLFAVLTQKKATNDKAYWFYCYYCASLLETFYQAYRQPENEKKFRDLKDEIQRRAQSDHLRASDQKTFIASLKSNLSNGFKNLISSPLHAAKFRDYVGYTNVCRLYWVFCRLTLVNGFALAGELHLFDRLDAVLGTHTDPDKIISVLKAPNGILNYLSIGLFLMRFAIDAGMLIKHTFFAKGEEKNSSKWVRFKYELNKRHGNFANDLTWTTVNFLTNFNHITGISNAAAGVITAVFLGFDVSMSLYQLYLAKQEYSVKKRQYTEELQVCIQSGKSSDLIEKQIKELDIEWKTKRAKCAFITAGAALLMIGYSSTLLFSAPGVIIASFFTCVVAAAIYLSVGSFTLFAEKSLRLEHDKGVVAQKEYELALKDFMFTMAKNTVVPSVLITTFAIYWPVAVGLLAVQIGYELYHASNQHQGKQDIERLSYESPSPA